MKKQPIQASVKDERLVKKRREQMIKGAITLFKKKGFHRTTTREIAKASGFSIGTLYEYIRKKEDILYLVCDRIYDEVHSKIRTKHGRSNREHCDGLNRNPPYFRMMDEMQDELLVMYQESKSLTKKPCLMYYKRNCEMTFMFEKC